MKRIGTTSRLVRLLDRHQAGDGEALSDLIAEVYRELRVIARKQLRGRPGHVTLTPTAVVNEAFLTLRKRDGLAIESRHHFFAIAAQCMRWVISDYARAKRVAKRGAGERRVTFDERALAAVSPDPDLALSGLDAALNKLTRQDPRLARIVEMRFLLGMSVEETAEALGISPSTVKRDWLVAKTWLARELDEKEEAA